MKALDFETMVEKINTAKEKKARIEGAMENILSGWKEEYDITSIKQAKAKLEELDAELDDLEKHEKQLTSQLEDLMDWDTL